MTNKKLIFIIVSALLLLLVLFIALKLNSKTWNSSNNKTTAWDFKIWILNDDKDKFNKFLDNFKALNKNYSKKTFVVESFDNYREYEKVLASAIAKWQGPDIFMLNNNTSSFIDDNISWIDPKIINPNDFRKKYKWVFWDDLIVSSKNEKTWKQVEFLKWLPIWYETLGIYYNRKYVKASELSTMANLSNLINKIKSRKSSLIPIWMWNGSTVVWSEDIITQLFMFEDINSIWEAAKDKIRWAFGSYFSYWKISWDNRYDSRFVSMKQNWKNNLDLFTDSSVVMVVWYPKILDKIAENWYSKAFLYVAPFPHYFSWVWKTLLNYNYFVVNKNTTKQSIANDLFKYMSSDSGAWKYLDQFTYYLPSLLSLESDKFDSKVNSNYNIVLKDFLDIESELSSFDKWLKSVYDSEIIKILDDPSNYISLFEKMKNSISCKKDKITNLENLSKSCK